MWNRRVFLAAAAAASAVPPAGRSLAMATGVLDLQQAARQAWIYAYPLLLTASVYAAEVPKRQPANVLVSKLNLLDLNTQSLTQSGANNDTLYSRGWLDLSKGPVQLTLPAAGRRYISVALRDMYTNNFCILGTRTTGPDGGAFTVVGPDSAASGDVIRAPQSLVWVLTRVLVDGPSDLAAARLVQAGIGARGGADRAITAPALPDAAWQDYFRSAQAWIELAPPPATDTALFRRIDALGLRPGGAFDPSRFSAREAAQIAAGVAQAKTDIRGLGTDHIANGWIYPNPDAGLFREDYLERATYALAGIGGLPPVEAMYLTPLAPNGGWLFDDDKLHRLHFDKGQLPPADAFWSLTMYEATPDGRFLLTDNPLRRYSIGDRTPNLEFGPDGSLDIWISRTDPGGQRSANWLPAPAKGPFDMTLRCYLPRQSILNGDYRLPPIEAV